jgi:hypothetical protein
LQLSYVLPRILTNFFQLQCLHIKSIYSDSDEEDSPSPTPGLRGGPSPFPGTRELDTTAVFDDGAANQATGDGTSWVLPDFIVQDSEAEGADEEDYTPADDASAQSSEDNDQVGQNTMNTNIDLFELVDPPATTLIRVKVDIDSVSMITGDLWKLACILASNRDSPSKTVTFEFCSNLDRFADKTNKSRFSVACNGDYKPTVINRKRRQFGFHLLKNLKICKVNICKVNYVISLHLFDPNMVYNPYFNDKMLGGICLAMNTARLHPTWLTDHWDQNDVFPSEDVNLFKSGVKNVENFTTIKNGSRAYTTLDCDHGKILLILFQAALVYYSEQNPEWYVTTAPYKDRDIHLQCYHGRSKYPATKLECIKESLEACKYMVEHGVWSCVAAGTKSSMAGKWSHFEIGQKAEMQTHIFKEAKERQVELTQLFPDVQDHDYNWGGAAEWGIHLWDGIIFQHDVGIEVKPVQQGVNFYPCGPRGLNLVKKTITKCTRAHMEAALNRLVNQNHNQGGQHEYHGGSGEDQGSRGGEGDDDEDADDEDNNLEELAEQASARGDIIYRGNNQNER